MARNADIRLYLVKQFPYASLRDFLAAAEQIEKGIKQTLTGGFTLPSTFAAIDFIKYMGDSKSMGFTVRTPTKFTNELGDMEFTVASLAAFIDELKVMVFLRDMGGANFGQVVIPPNDDIMYSFGHESDMYNIFNAELFSCLTRRFQNRGRRGCDNDYHFELKFPLDLVPVNVSIKDISFRDDKVYFRLFIDTEIMHNALGGQYVFTAPVNNGQIHVDIKRPKPVITLHRSPEIDVTPTPIVVETMNKDVLAKVEEQKVGLLKRFINKFF